MPGPGDNVTDLVKFSPWTDAKGEMRKLPEPLEEPEPSPEPGPDKDDTGNPEENSTAEENNRPIPGFELVLTSGAFAGVVAVKAVMRRRFRGN